MKKQLTAVAFAMACAVSTQAGASRLEQVDMTFQSGATFDGIVTFADDFSAATAVDGTLVEAGFGSQTIGWLWDNGVGNLSTGASNYGIYLMPGTIDGGDYDDFVQLAVNYANPSQLTFTVGQSQYGTDNYLDYLDPLANGTITEILQPPVSTVPELSATRMLCCGLIVLLAAALRRKRNR